MKLAWKTTVLFPDRNWIYQTLYWSCNFIFTFSRNLIGPNVKGDVLMVGSHLLLLASYGRSCNFTGLNVYTFTIDLLLIIYIIVAFVIRKPLIFFTMLSPKIKTNVLLLFLLLALLLLLLLALLLSLSLFAWLVFTIFHCN